MVGKKDVSGSGPSEERRAEVLLEKIGSNVQTVLEGHATLHQEIGELGKELRGKVDGLGQKFDLYLRGLRQEIQEVERKLTERMDAGFERLGKQLEEHVHLN